MTTVADTGRNKAEASRSFSSLKKIDARISVKRFQAAGLRIVHIFPTASAGGRPDA